MTTSAPGEGDRRRVHRPGPDPIPRRFREGESAPSRDAPEAMDHRLARPRGAGEVANNARNSIRIPRCERTAGQSDDRDSSGGDPRYYRYVADGEWTRGLKGAQPFHIGSSTSSTRRRHPVFVCEQEDHADALGNLGVVSSCIPRSGHSGPGDAAALKGREVILVPADAGVVWTKEWTPLAVEQLQCMPSAIRMGEPTWLDPLRPGRPRTWRRRPGRRRSSGDRHWRGRATGPRSAWETPAGRAISSRGLPRSGQGLHRGRRRRDRMPAGLRRAAVLVTAGPPTGGQPRCG